MRFNHKVICTLLLCGLVLACSDDDASFLPSNNGEKPEQDEYSETLNFHTDKARYDPGEEVVFSVSEVPAGAKVRYRYLGKTIEENTMSGKTWAWSPPSDDFKGYMIELITDQGEKEKIIGTTAIDVSSDWTRFPRYGFLSEFGNISAENKNVVINNLKDYHINGLQYYDWHYKHHIPLPSDENENPANTWKDLFGRDIYLETVEGYIQNAKEKNIASMFYNLLFGVFNEEDGDGISDTWMVYKDRFHNAVDGHFLEGFGTIKLTDPGNDDWQDYIFRQTETVYQHLDFDGWHLDQLGNRGTLYGHGGYEVSLPDGYHHFLMDLNQRFPDKKAALNAVDQFGQKEILDTPVDFAYTEVWGRSQYVDLARVILENNEYSEGKLNIVLAAYLNYDAQEGEFNTPSVLMADAVIFAFGGAHLELGEHMLSSEYFPSDKLTMSEDLKASLREYYDFLVAYQNILREGGSFNLPVIRSASSDIQLNNWPPVYGKIAVVGKEFEDKQVLHLLNFEGLSTLEWKDNDRIQTAPAIKNDFEVTVTSAQNVSRVWFASPDYKGGAPQELEFQNNNGQTTVTVPYLEYWSMIVVEP